MDLGYGIKYGNNYLVIIQKMKINIRELEIWCRTQYISTNYICFPLICINILNSAYYIIETHIVHKIKRVSPVMPTATRLNFRYICI